MKNKTLRRFNLIILVIGLFSLILPLSKINTAYADTLSVDKDIVNAGKTFKKDDVNALLKGCVKYKLLPSFKICQLYWETNWGTAGSTGKVDNNWGGMKMPGAGSGVKVTGGTWVTEYGHTSQYAHYDTLEEYFTDYTYLMREGAGYKVSGVANFEQAILGLKKEGGTGAEKDYFEAPLSEYKAGLISVRASINQQNNNVLDELDKKAVDSGWDGSLATEEETAKSTKDAVETIKEAIADDTFTLNGYGSLTEKDWQEQIASAEDYVASLNPEEDFSDNQKGNLSEWIDDYNAKNTSTTVRYTHLGITILGYLILIFDLILTLAYAFDRVGILEISAVEMVTFNKLSSAYAGEDSTFLKRKYSGQVKTIATKDIVVINMLLVGLFTLVVTGQIYVIGYTIYQIIQSIIQWGNSLH